MPIRKIHRRLWVEALERRQLLAADVQHNYLEPLDVNNDSLISSADALVVINQLNRGPAVGQGAVERFLDVNDDSSVSPLDALRVLNCLNRRSVVDVDSIARGRMDASPGVRVGVRMEKESTGIDFEVRLQNGTPGETHAVAIEGQYVGSVVVDVNGRGKLRVSPEEGPEGLLPQFLLEGLHAAQIAVDRIGNVDIASSMFASGEGPDDSSAPTPSAPTVLATRFSLGGENRGEALFVNHRDAQYVGVYHRGLVAGESYAVQIDGREVLELRANRLGVILGRVRLGTLDNAPAVAVGSRIEVLGGGSGVFARVGRGADGGSDSEDREVQVYRAHLQAPPGVRGLAGLMVTPERQRMGITVAGLPRSSSYPLKIDGIQIATVTTNRLGMLFFRYDSQRSGEDDLLAEIPPVGPGSTIEIGDIVSASWQRVARFDY